MDLTTKVGVLAGGAALVGLLVLLRFCGDVSVAARPGKPPKAREKSVGEVTRETNADSETYLKGILADAARANLPVPSLEDLGKAFKYARDDRRFTLVPDTAAVDVAGLKIAAKSFRAAGSEKLLVVEITNPGASPVAYQIETEISGGDPACFGRTILEHNAMVVAPGKTERRSECAYKRGMEVYVARVETAVLSPFAAFYVSRLQPQAVGARERIANGHKPVGVPLCGLAMSASIRSALSEGSVRWRDLVDFYARHSCETYQFPMEYKAFTSDGERPLPDVGE